MFILHEHLRSKLLKNSNNRNINIVHFYFIQVFKPTDTNHTDHDPNLIQAITISLNPSPNSIY